jgi:hypothetical protein
MSLSVESRTEDFFGNALSLTALHLNALIKQTNVSAPLSDDATEMISRECTAALPHP